MPGVVGFAEGPGVVFVKTIDYVSFHTPGIASPLVT
jgi:hypothetical protein